MKCQVHAGGRGKAGGVKVVKSKEEIRAFAEHWLGKRPVTYQTDANGQPVNQILVEAATDIDKELYLGAVVDRSSRRVVFMASTEGGVEIEKVAEETPHLIHKIAIDPLAGPMPRVANWRSNWVWKVNRFSSSPRSSWVWRPSSGARSGADRNQPAGYHQAGRPDLPRR